MLFSDYGVGPRYSHGCVLLLLLRVSSHSAPHRCRKTTKVAEPILKAISIIALIAHFPNVAALREVGMLVTNARAH
jgi:hypothetical protein